MNKALIGAALALSCTTSGAQEFPTKLIRIVNAAGPDAVARMVAEGLRQAWGQPVIVENKIGAGGIVAAQEVAGSEPDGHTMMFCASAQFMAAPYYKNSIFMTTGIGPVTQVTTMPFILSVNASVPANNVKELIQLAKAQPGKLNYASSGLGTPPHLVMEMFKADSGADIFHVSYKTIAQATTDLIGKQVQVMFVVATAAAPLIKSGQIRALAVSTTERSAFLSGLPTLQEAAGLIGSSADAWNGFCVPTATPARIVNRLYTEINRIIHEPETQKRIEALGNQVIGSPPEQFGAYMKSEQAKWAKVAAALGPQPQ